jgi:hypothetical protein
MKIGSLTKRRKVAVRYEEGDRVDTPNDVVRDMLVEQEKDTADRLANVRHPPISNPVGLTEGRS